MNLLQGLFVSVGLSSVIASPLHISKLSFNWHDTKFLLAFGDSYTYVQGTAGRQNYSFIGDLQNYSYTPQQLLSNKIVQNQIGTSAGGPNWVEYLTGCFSGPPSKCKKQLWDFAFAGSDISTTYTPLHHNYTVSFENQIIRWEAYAKSVVPVNVSKALVAIFIGINDINDSSKYTFPRNNATDFPSFYTEIVHKEFESIEAIYEAGYKNFLFMNLPPLERTPGNQASPTPLPNSTMIDSYNSILNLTTHSFQSSHSDTNIMLFDTYSFLSGILDDPQKYGIKNTTGFCERYDAPDIEANYREYGCLRIEEYFWYNSGHITWKVHSFLAEAVGRFMGDGRGGNGYH